MARTEERIRTIDSTTAPPTATPPLTTTSPGPDTTSRRSTPLAIAWLILVPLAVALQPAAAVAEAGWLDYVVSYALLASIVMAVTGLVRGTSWSGGATLGAAGIFLASTFACPATGHHAFGLWWFGQLAIAASLVAMSAVYAWRRRTT